MTVYSIADYEDSIQSAIEACASAGGGTVLVPPGIHESDPLELRNHVTLHIEKGGEVRFVPDFERYRPVWTRWEGVACHALHPCIFGSNLSDVAIEGEGILNGSGEAWWRELHRRRRDGPAQPDTPWERELARLNPDFATRASGGGGRELQFLRPPLLQLLSCTDVRIEGVTCIDPPFWNTHIVECSRVTVENVIFRSPPEAPNTDGLDIESSSDVTIIGCRFHVGDDCLALKAGSEVPRDGAPPPAPTERIEVRDCRMERGHGAVVIGSETAGGIRDVSVSNCFFRGTDRGIRIKTRRGRGGDIRRLRFTALEMEDVLTPFVINMFYRCGIRREEVDLLSPTHRAVDGTTPAIADVEIGGVHARGVRASAGYICGLPERPATGLWIHDVVIELVHDRGDVASPRDAAMAQGPPEPQTRDIFMMWTSGERLENITLR